MENLDRRHLLAGAGLVGAAAFAKLAHAGPLNPPAGSVAGSGKTSQEIFDRLDQTLALKPLAEPYVTANPGGGLTINLRGHYYLTGSLVPSSGVAITVNADCIIDLNGHTIDASASNVAIGTSGSALSVVVRNGRILGQSVGVTGTNALINTRTARYLMLENLFMFTSNSGLVAGIDVTADRCTFDGSSAAVEQFLAQSGRVSDCLFTSCRQKAIAQVPTAGFESFANRLIVERCRVTGYVGNAIELTAPGIVRDCVISPRSTTSPLSSTANGIVLGNGGIVERCVVENAAQAGILVQGGGAEVLSNRVSGCGQGGIVLREVSSAIATAGALVRGNVCTAQFATAAAGIRVAVSTTPSNNSGHVIDDNLMISNWRNLEVQGGYNLITRNRLSFAGPGGQSIIGATNAYGPFVNCNNTDLSTVTNSDHPQANLLF
jgi:hypothetical protein